MGAILLIEWPAPNPLEQQAARERLAALAALEPARLLFAASEAGGTEPIRILAIGFSAEVRAEAALSRWRAEGALPASARARVLVEEACGAAEAPLLLFP